ncbi:MAG TPA: iron-containing alcohol dehydrogenase [Bacillota bacterium]|nr:iron-containing alcohol dehydrogenase [Bacillota bacterium]
MNLPGSYFAWPTRLFWGRGVSSRVGEITREFGERVFLAVSPSLNQQGLLEPMLKQLNECKITTKTMEFRGEPEIDQVESALVLARDFKADCILGMGGGSAMDAGKAIAGLFYEENPVRQYLNGLPIKRPGLPLITVPTVAGSGAEVTPNAVLSDSQSSVKMSIRHGHMAARVTMVDPELMLGVNPQTTAWSGLDGLCQAIEAFTSKGANEFTDLLAKEAALRFSRFLQKAVTDGNDLEARESLALASVMGGIALAAARLGAVHGLAHPIGIRYKQPHGKVCAVLLPMVMRYNMPVACEKYAELAKALELIGPGMDQVDQAVQFVRFVMSLNKSLAIPQHLRELGLLREDFEKIVEESLPSGSLKANPRPVTADELTTILRENW